MGALVAYNFNNSHKYRLAKRNNITSLKLPKNNSLMKTNGIPKARPADPIKDIEALNAIKDYLLSTGAHGYRNYMIFLVGINVGRRCGDILKLRIKDVWYNGKIKDLIVHVEEKTGKVIEFFFNKTVREAMTLYIQSLGRMQPDDFLFKSQKGDKLTTRSYWRILQNVQKSLELDYHLSTHTMRKSMGYWTYQTNKDVKAEGGFDAVDMLQEAFGHSSRKQTMTYIGITRENKKAMFESISL